MLVLTRPLESVVHLKTSDGTISVKVCEVGKKGPAGIHRTGQCRNCP